MPSTRDLVEAQAFGRRRLVTALVSGAPGHEPEPSGPGRAVVGGVALALLLVAGYAVAGLLIGRDPAGWDRPGLLVSQDTGALYLIVEERDEPVLHAVGNATSARLILGEDLDPTVLAEDTIAAQRRGEDLGIAGAPPTVPDGDRLVQDGWTACTSGGGALAVDVSPVPGARPVAGSGLTVHSEGRYHVVATAREEPGKPRAAYRYALPDGVEPDPLLAALGLPITAEATEVPGRWLRLFPPGGDLSLTPDGYGGPAPQQGPGRLPVGARIGQLVTVDGETVSLLTAHGPAELDPFALAVYRAAPRPAVVPPVGLEPVRLDAAPQVTAARPPYAGAHWPDDLLQAVTGEPCALLDAGPGRPPATLLASDPDDASSAAGLVAPAVRVGVRPGHGAYVRAGDRELVVAPPGVAHPLADDEAAGSLGYEPDDASLVPDAWLELFEPGVALSRAAALAPPSPGGA